MFDEIKKTINKLKDRWNAALSKMPPIEQVQSAETAHWVLERLQGINETASDLFSQVESELSELDKKFQSEVQVAVQQSIDEKKKAGELLDKVTAQAALDAELKKKEDEFTGRLQKMEQDAILVEQRRADLKDELPGCVIEALPNELLTSENFSTEIMVVQSRFLQINEAGIKSEGFLKNVAAMGVDDEGKSQFENAMEVVQSLQPTEETKETKSAAKPSSDFENKDSAKGGVKKQFAF